jgi:hypothetical protein
MMEYYCSDAPDKMVTVSKIWTLAVEKFVDSMEPIIAYMNFLLRQNDENNARVLFEKVCFSSHSPSLLPVQLIFIFARTNRLSAPTASLLSKPGRSGTAGPNGSTRTATSNLPLPSNAACANSTPLPALAPNSLSDSSHRDTKIAVSPMIPSNTSTPSRTGISGLRWRSSGTGVRVVRHLPGQLPRRRWHRGGSGIKKRLIWSNKL